MSKTITINGLTYMEALDKRFAGCEFCDVRIKAYDYFKNVCNNVPPADRPCSSFGYLKAVNYDNKDI